MKERPILFSGPMVRAILDDHKTQTRRIVKPQPDCARTSLAFTSKNSAVRTIASKGGRYSIFCPYGQPCDRLWVRETITLKHVNSSDFLSPVYAADGEHVIDQEGKRASNHEFIKRKSNPSIHMPRWASRILLEIVSARVERLQDITEADAIAEGIERRGPGNNYFKNYCYSPKAGHPINQITAHGAPLESFRSLWQSINGPESWDANPWVWVVEFKRIKP